MIYTDGIHLMTDGNIAELHKFAQGIRLKSKWFQDHKRHPHYDIWGIKLPMAVTAGAIIVSSKELIKLCRTSYRTKVEGAEKWTWAEITFDRPMPASSVIRINLVS